MHCLPGWKGTALLNRLTNLEGTCLGQAHPIVSSFLPVSGPILPWAGPGSVFWNFPGYTHRTGLFPILGLPTLTSPHATGLTKRLLDGNTMFFPAVSFTLSLSLSASLSLTSCPLFRGRSEQGSPQSWLTDRQPQQWGLSLQGLLRGSHPGCLKAH